MCASPASTPLDDVDRGILQLLQRDARHTSAVDIAKQVGVTDSTVHNRIQNLEDQGIIEGYVPMTNYEQAGYPLQIRFICTAPIVEWELLARDALQVEGVVEVHEIMAGSRNVAVKAVALDNDDVTRIALALDELGLDIESQDLIRHHYFRSFNHFGTDDISADTDGIFEA